MSPEEHSLLAALFERVKTAAASPRDGDAESFVDQAVRAQPSAPYYLAQAVIVQEKGLEAAAAHIGELEARIRQLESEARSPAHESTGGGFLSSIFGSSDRPQPAPASDRYAPGQSTHGATQGPWNAAPRSEMTPPPQAASQPSYGQPSYGQPSYAQPSYAQPSYGGPWDRPPQQQPSAAGGFLRGAMGTAAGVAGGMLLANSLSGLFGSHMSSLGLGQALPASAPIEETVINNNYYGDDAITQASDATPDQADDGWQQADLDTGGDDGFTDDFGSDTTDV